jgi:hypothetical protein
LLSWRIFLCAVPPASVSAIEQRSQIGVAGSGRKTGYGNPRPEELTIVNELVAFPAVV